MDWLTEFSNAAAKTDRLVGNPNHATLLAAGLAGEIGSILAEVKKEIRELDAYPFYRKKLLEEVGDSLWYFVRLVTVLDSDLLNDLAVTSYSPQIEPLHEPLFTFLDLGAHAGALLAAIKIKSNSDIRVLLSKLWATYLKLSRDAKLDLQVAARENILKNQRRWPSNRTYAPFFDDEFLEEDQLPRELDIEFRERVRGSQRTVILRCNGVNFGDRLTDNIEDPDWYRYHDIFHFAYAVHLGWSPVIRALLHCKRKSNPKIDEAQDGARAIILDEAVSATVFSQAKHLSFFDGINHVDYDLLKSISRFVDGYEVSQIPLWQWEVAILDGYRVFRHLRNNGGGRVKLFLKKHEIEYIAKA